MTNNVGLTLIEFGLIAVENIVTHVNNNLNKKLKLVERFNRSKYEINKRTAEKYLARGDT